jgi:hypothetical protein
MSGKENMDDGQTDKLNPVTPNFVCGGYDNIFTLVFISKV